MVKVQTLVTLNDGRVFESTIDISARDKWSVVGILIQRQADVHVQFVKKMLEGTLHEHYGEESFPIHQNHKNKETLT